MLTLRWRHNGHDCVSNHQPHHCLLKRLFGRRSRKTSKLRVTGLCAGNSPGPVNSPHKGPVTRKMFPFDDVIMNNRSSRRWFETPRHSCSVAAMDIVLALSIHLTMPLLEDRNFLKLSEECHLGPYQIICQHYLLFVKDLCRFAVRSKFPILSEECQLGPYYVLSNNSSGSGLKPFRRQT